MTPARPASERAARRFAVYALAAGLAWGVLGVTEDPARRLVARRPGLDPEMARHLLSADDSTLVRYCRRVGWSRCHSASLLLPIRDATSLEAFQRSEREVRRARRRLRWVFGPAFGLWAQSQEDLAAQDAPLAERYRRALLADSIERVARDFGDSVEIRIARLERLAASGLATGLRITALNRMTDLAHEAGDRGRALGFLRDALAQSLLTERQPMTSQLLGTLGEAKLQQGDLDSMAICWQWGLDLATRNRVGPQASRLCMFFASHHAAQGRWALAEDYMREASRFSQVFGSSGDGFQVLMNGLELHHRLGSWDRLQRGLRVAGVEARAARTARTQNVEALEVVLLELRALDAAHRGDLEVADRLFAQAEAALGGRSLRLPTRARLLLRWGRASLEHGRTVDAVATLRRGLAYADTMHIPEHVPALAAALAEAMLAAGSRDGCRDALATFQRAAARDTRISFYDWSAYDEARVKWHSATGDRDGFVATLRQGLARVEARLAAVDRSPERYHVLNAAQGLRESMHEWVADDPAAGYRIERLWRRGSRSAGDASERGSLRACADVVSAHRPGGEHRPAAVPAPAAVTGRDRVEVVYFVGERAVMRWTSTRGGLRRDALPIAPRALEQRVADVVSAMCAEPEPAGAPPDAKLAGDLRSLALELLPAEVTAAEEAAGKSWLELLPDSYLARLPFAALNVSSRGYRPLIQGWNVAGIHPAPTRAPSSDGAGVIVADPHPSDWMRRAHGTEQLTRGLAEAGHVARSDPRATLLQGASATKRELLRRWESAEYVYFATHVVQDPEVRYTSFIPLAPDASAHGPQSEYLEVADVLGADLDACRLVVLSGCRSGGSVARPGGVGPSLAEAFIDAGVGAVVRTAWDVRDDDADALMSEFVRLWRSESRSPVLALNAALRSRAVGPSGFRHPASWAAYGIDVARPETLSPRAAPSMLP